MREYRRTGKVKGLKKEWLHHIVELVRKPAEEVLLGFYRAGWALPSGVGHRELYKTLWSYFVGCPKLPMA
jgi:hypothetical protein